MILRMIAEFDIAAGEEIPTGCERGSRDLKGRRRELVPTPSSGGISL
jgi:hypothetical protein